MNADDPGQKAQGGCVGKAIVFCLWTQARIVHGVLQMGCGRGRGVPSLLCAVSCPDHYK